MASSIAVAKGHLRDTQAQMAPNRSPRRPTCRLALERGGCFLPFLRQVVIHSDFTFCRVALKHICDVQRQLGSARDSNVFAGLLA
jgi:hypothetical protein